MKKNKSDKKKKMRIIHVGRHKKTVMALWVVLIMSVCFGVYKNFTAVDTHTVHEKKIIKEQLLDTNSIENFVTNFAKVYYSWENNKASLDARTNAINGYLTTELQNLNIETIRQDIPTSASVKDVNIWSVSSKNDKEYVVTYSVIQQIKEGETVRDVTSCYKVTVYVDNGKNMVIIKNPTLSSIPTKSGYAPKVVENDNSVDVDTINDATEFLNTFFKLYPVSTKQELVYYVKDEVLKPVTGDYVFSELVNPVFVKGKKENIVCYVAVKYLDSQTKVTQVSQYELELHKGDNWMIVGVQ